MAEARVERRLAAILAADVGTPNDARPSGNIRKRKRTINPS